MKNKLLIIGILSLAAMIFLAGCTKSTSSTNTSAPTVASADVETSSSSVESSSGSFVSDSTPTNDQVVPDLS